MNIDDAKEKVVAALDAVSDTLSAAEYCELLDELIAEFQSRRDAAEGDLED